MDVEYISLHGCIRNTSSNTEVHAEHQLTVDRSTWPEEKNIQNHTKLGRMKKLGGETGVLVGLDLPSPGGETEAGVHSHIEVWVRGETFKAESETADLRQPDGMRISPCRSHTHTGEGHKSPRKHSGCELEQSQGEGCCWVQGQIEEKWGRRL